MIIVINVARSRHSLFGVLECQYQEWCISVVGVENMRKIWKDHSLTILLVLFALLTLAAGVWSTWTEFRHNEQAGLNHTFWSVTFMAYFGMQVFMNFLPELMGLITIVLLTKRFREKFSAESND
jgi:uncharacterized membrane protein HdeD (DUF308 family)